MRTLAALVVTVLTAALLAINPIAAPGADAAVSAKTSTKALSVAAAQHGKRYRYGGASPSRGFDCSGLTSYAYKKVGKKLPRTAQGQYRAATRISKKRARPGDLVFFRSGGYTYHVAIYAGKGKIWHSPRPGKRVSKVKLWTSRVSYGRVR